MWRVIAGLFAGLFSAVSQPTIAITANSDVCAEFYINGKREYRKCGASIRGGRGLNVATIHSTTGEIEEAYAFDTWARKNEANAELLKHLRRIPAGHLVLMAVGDANYFTADVITELQDQFGSQQAKNQNLWDTWSFIGIKGRAQPLAEQLNKKNAGG